MAALRLGVGDVFTVCKSVVDLCAKATTTSHDEIKDIRILVAEMEAMREHLNVVHTKIHMKCDDKAGRDDVTPLLTRSLSPIHNDLLNLQQTLQTHHHRKASCHVLDQARYMLHYKAQLSAFKECMPRHRESICAIQEVFENESSDTDIETESGKRNRRQSILKLAGLVEREEMRREDECYDLGWMDEALKYRATTGRGSIESVIEEQVEPNEIEDSKSGQETPNSITNIETLKRPLSPITKGTFLQPFPDAYSKGVLFTKPAFKLDVFDSFSCTNTPDSSPQSELIEEAP